MECFDASENVLSEFKLGAIPLNDFKIYGLLLGLPLLITISASAAAPPAVGEKAPDFRLASTKGTSFRLSEKLKNTIVLVVLRGYPGYQCPNCNRQVQDFVRNASAFAEAGASVVFIYPGPSDQLAAKADEFLKEKPLPNHFEMLLDPNYAFTKAYDLRWDAPNETAYPSTFLIDRRGVVFFSKVAKSHGGRTSATEILKALPKKPSDAVPE